MSFHVVRHERTNIFVLNRQTYETYRFTIGDDVAVAHVGPPSDLSEARRAAIAFLATHDNLDFSASQHDQQHNTKDHDSNHEGEKVESGHAKRAQHSAESVGLRREPPTQGRREKARLARKAPALGEA
jgi:hypothetical protein